MNVVEVYSGQADPREYLATAKLEGAILLKRFVPDADLETLTDAILAEELREVDRSGHKVPEQFRDTGWEFEAAPPLVRALGKRVCALVQAGLPGWSPNDVRAQLYSPGEVGIEWHRDYKRDMGIVAVVSALGFARFDIQLGSGEASWDLEPGDLVLMRGSLLNGPVDDRPRHRVFPPTTGQRLSIAYRQVASTVPKLESGNE